MPRLATAAVVLTLLAVPSTGCDSGAVPGAAADPGSGQAADATAGPHRPTRVVTLAFAGDLHFQLHLSSSEPGGAIDDGAAARPAQARSERQRRAAWARVPYNGRGRPQVWIRAGTQESETTCPSSTRSRKARVSDSDLEVSDLGFEPASAAAQVTITDANGKQTTRQLPPFGRERCATSALGGLHFQGDPAIPELGPGPYSYCVRLTLDGETYVGTRETSGPAPSDVVWSPPLPAYAGE
jgi:hypothetical protein